jgi:hypothetical protein
MDTLSLYGSGTNPDIIIGKYSTEGMNPAVANVLDNNPAFKSWSGARVNKYEFWFSTTISFIPYSGESVFITDVSGNLTHTGNLLTKKDATINGDVTIDKNLQVKKDITVDNDLKVKNTLVVEKDVKLNSNLQVVGDIRVTGNILAANIGELIDKVGSLGDIKSTLDKLKTDIEKLTKALDALKTASTSSSSKEG